MAPTTRATVRPTGDRSPTVLPGQRRYERSRPLVAGLGLRLARQLVPAALVQCLPEPAAGGQSEPSQTRSTTGPPTGTRASLIKEAPATLTCAASKV